jgi:hypothetical protein
VERRGAATLDAGPCPKLAGVDTSDVDPCRRPLGAATVDVGDSVDFRVVEVLNVAGI